MDTLYVKIQSKPRIAIILAVLSLSTITVFPILPWFMIKKGLPPPPPPPPSQKNYAVNIDFVYQDAIATI